MKLLLIAMMMSTTVFAHEFKSKDFCSSTTKDICAHIGHDAKPDTQKPFEFTFDIVNKVKAKDVTDVVISVVTKSDKKSENIPTTWTIRPDGHHWDAKASTTAKYPIVGILAKFKYKTGNEEIFIELK